jgi:hypothetical protein
MSNDCNHVDGLGWGFLAFVLYLVCLVFRWYIL